MEFILLCALPVVITTQMPSLQTDDLNLAIVTALSLFILLPIPLVLLFGSKLMHNGWKGWSAATQSLRDTLDVDEKGDGKTTV